MKLISKFHDYYDTALGHGFDPTVVFKRINKQIQVDDFVSYYYSKSHGDSKTLKHLPKFSDIYQHFPNVQTENYRYYKDKAHIESVGIVYFCNYICPFVSFCLDNRKTHYVYDFENFEHVVKLYFSDATKEEYNINRSFSKFNRQNIKKLFNYHKTKIDNINVDYIKHFESPVIKYEKTINLHLLDVNPILKDIEFYKVFDAYTAFQELSMFVSGILGGTFPPIVEVSDEIRKQKHGFHDMSFKKRRKK